MNDRICIDDVKFPRGIESEIEADKIVLVINETRLDDTITADALDDKIADFID